MHSLQPPEELRKQLQAIGSQVEKPPGSFLFQRGDGVTGVFLIVHGLVRLGLERDLPTFPARFLGPGSVVGLPATLSGLPHTLNAEVVEDAKLAFVSSAQLQELLRDNAELCMEVINMLNDDLLRTREAIERTRENSEEPGVDPSGE